MKSASISFGVFLLFALGGCSSIRVASDFDSGLDLSQYSTFMWVEDVSDDPSDAASLLDVRIANAVELELAHNGLQLEENSPDLFVRFTTRVDEHVVLPRRGAGGDGRGTGGRRGQEPRVFTEGTLVVDLIDPNLDQTVWRGWAIGVVDPNDQSEKTVAAFVKAVLDELPAR